MKRILTWSLALAFALVITGCQSWGKKTTLADQTGDTTAIDNVKPETDETQAPQPTDEMAPQPIEQPAGGRIHVVQRGDTLFKLARQYYNGDASQWKRIYEANRAQIPNRDVLKVGQQLVIP